MKPYNEIEFNILCAEFLGWEQGEDGRYWKETPTESSNWYVDEMYFHSDWNWIMEVVEKIDNIFVFEDYSISMTLETDGLSIITVHYYQPDRTKQKRTKQFTSKSKNKKEAVVEAIWQFLNWYNEQK